MEGSTIIIAGFGPGQVGEADGPIEGLGEGWEPGVRAIAASRVLVYSAP
jgi:hypothetical protein